MATTNPGSLPKTAKRPQPKGGSRKGKPNKATANAKEAIARFVDGNADRLNAWLDEIEAADGPKAAFQCFIDLVEFHVPKLARTVIAGDQDAPLRFQRIENVIIDPPKR